MLRTAKFTLAIAIILVVACFAKRADAGITVSIDWDDTLSNGIQSSISANEGQTVIATIVFEITAGSSISGYEMSTRFSTAGLQFVSRVDTGPANLIATGVATNNNPNAMASFPPLGNYGTNNQIQGQEPSGFNPGPVAGPAFAVSAITFTVLPGANGVVILPGLFDTTFDRFQDNNLDRIPDGSIVFNGGSVTAVPEPSSIALLATPILFVGFRRSFRKRFLRSVAK